MENNVRNQPDYLGNVKNEVVNITQRIQGHGFLIALNSKYIITHLSENLVFILSEDPRNYLGKHLSELAAKLKLKANGNAVQLERILPSGLENNGLEYVNPFLLDVGLQPYNLIVHHSGEHVVLEFENVLALTFDSHKVIETSMSGVFEGKTVAAIMKNAVEKIKKITGYDRVMVSKIDKNGLGLVITEAREAGIESHLGIHYPPSRVSRHARELYKRNLSHIISDTDCIESAVIAFDVNEAPLDLTHSVLRAASPVYMQYLNDAGVASDFSLSLISNGELWGIMVCQNYISRFINYGERNAAESIARGLSSSVDLQALELAMPN